jgi:hypothetical protein
VTSDVWVPGAAGPQDELVRRVVRRIERFAGEHGVAKAVVEVELRDGARYRLDAIAPEPGFGFVTLRPHRREDEIPDELIVPVGALSRIELYATDDPEPPFGFSAVPEQAG